MNEKSWQKVGCEYRMFYCWTKAKAGLPWCSVVKNLPTNTEEVGSIPGSGRSPGEGNSNPL